MTHDQLRRYLQSVDAQHIGRCIDDCMRAPDERGRWRPKAECEVKLAWGGEPTAADRAAAAAARRIGAWLAGVGLNSVCGRS